MFQIPSLQTSIKFKGHIPKGNGMLFFLKGVLFTIPETVFMEVYREVPEGPDDLHGVRVSDNVYNVGISSVPHTTRILHLAYRIPMNMSRVLGFVFGGNRGAPGVNFP